MIKGDKNTISSRKNLSTNTPQNFNFKSPQVQTILKFKNRYTKTIQNPIEVIESLSFSHMPLKCFLHNNNLTLYCETDRKPLCASCMYQNNTHKGHKVIKIDNSQEWMKKDCERYSRIMIGVVDNINDLTKHMNEGINKMETQFPDLLHRIKHEYKKIYELIEEKQKQHMNQIRYYKEKMTYQHATLSAELKRIVLYVDEKLHHYGRNQEKQNLLVKRNIFEILSTSSSLISEELMVKSEITPHINFNAFREIEDILLGKFANLKCFESPKKKAKLDKTPDKSLMTSTRNLHHNEKASLSPASQKIKKEGSPKNITNRKKNISIRDVKEKTPAKVQSPRRKKQINDKSFENKRDRNRSKSTSNLKGHNSPKRK